jgi:flavodoxin
MEKSHEVKNMKVNDSKFLIAYFSRPGNNYVGGTIVNLPVGNTEVVAKLIQELTEGDIFRIESVNAYPDGYTETTEMAQQELGTNARPELAGHVENMASYDVIFLGYPIWWSTMPMPVFTFVEGYDFSRKTIAPFCTHEGSGFGHSITDIKKSCPHSTVLDGIAVRGGNVINARNEVAQWLGELGMTAKK